MPEPLKKPLLFSLFCLITAVLILSLLPPQARGESKRGSSIERICLSEDMRVARIFFDSPLQSRPDANPVIEDRITLLHEKTGVRITFPIVPENNGYIFYNYGLLLKKGDRVAVLTEGFLPAFAIIE